MDPFLNRGLTTPFDVTNRSGPLVSRSHHHRRLDAHIKHEMAAAKKFSAAICYHL
jgi:hypothetical protein